MLIIAFSLDENVTICDFGERKKKKKTEILLINYEGYSDSKISIAINIKYLKYIQLRRLLSIRSIKTKAHMPLSRKTDNSTHAQGLSS